MVFSSLFFTFIFLPVVLLLYFVAKEKYRNYILLAVSLLFYAYGEPAFVFIMLASIAVNYCLALRIDYKKRQGAEKAARCLLVLDIVVNLGLLFYFKYLDFSISIMNFIFKTSIQMRGIALPIGISFFTFQALSYVIDVYRKKVVVQKNPMYVALYISFFPQLIAGPIVRYSTIEQQIENRTCTLEHFAEGGRRFLLGFSKKVILANNLAAVVAEVWKMDVKQTNPLVLWVGAVCYTLHIFYDFSGYSDMAIGLGKIFGFSFEENFNYPYISKSITEFWRRWHISLGQWFRDYVYIPLGGSREGVGRHLLNLFVVWILTGIWHGASFSFVAWGLGYFILLVIEKYIVKPERTKSTLLRVIWRIVTLLCVNFGWVIFNTPSLRDGISYCLAMLGRYDTQFVIDDTIIRYVREYGFYMLTGILFATPVMKVLSQKAEGSKLIGTAKAVCNPVAYGLVFLWAVSFLILGVHNPFIYFNF